MKFHAVDRRLEGKTSLRQSQLAQIFLLDVFVEICQKFGLTYFLAYGTLLGAMRHNGFIPWDDDVDVFMPKKDMKKFLRMAQQLLPEYLMVKTYKNAPSYTEYTPKLMDRRTFFCEPWTHVPDPSGLSIDIFYLDTFPKLPVCIHKFFSYGISFTWHRWRKRAASAHRSIIGMCGDIIAMLFFRTSYCTLKLSAWCLNLFLPSVWIPSPEADKLVYQMKPEDIFPPITHLFEGAEYAIPRNPDAWLQASYGDWKVPPPSADRIVSHSIHLNVTHAPPHTWWGMPYGQTDAGSESC